jgi:hypothetical protein
VDPRGLKSPLKIEKNLKNLFLSQVMFLEGRRILHEFLSHSRRPTVRSNSAGLILYCEFFHILAIKYRYLGPDPDSPNDLDPDALNMDPKHWF